MSWQRICNRRHRVLRRGRTLIVWLSGTTGHSEWARNLRTRTVPRYDRRVKADLWIEAVTVVDEIIPMLDGVNEIIVAGFSRGGGLAQVVTLELFERGVRLSDVVTVMFAPKPAFDRFPCFPRLTCTAHRGDIVPFLPPWYGRLPVVWLGRFDWFWKAHDKAGHDAARWRYEVTKE